MQQTVQQVVQQTDLKRAAARVLARAHATDDATCRRQTAKTVQQTVRQTAPNLLHSAGVLVDMVKARQAVEAREQRRARVLEELEANPALERAWLETTAEDGSTVLTVAIRGVGSAELTVEPGRFDPFEFVRLQLGRPAAERNQETEQ